MKFTRTTFLVSVFFQLIFLLLDVAFNVISDKVTLRKENYTLLLLFVLQDACILMSLTLISLSLFRTNIFESGFMVNLLRRFKFTLFSSVFYLLITVGLQTETFLWQWNNSNDWPYRFIILRIMQRSSAVVYYYFTKRSILRLSDPRFYDEEWVKHTIAHTAEK